MNCILLLPWLSLKCVHAELKWYAAVDQGLTRTDQRRFIDHKLIQLSVSVQLEITSSSSVLPGNTKSVRQAHIKSLKLTGCVASSARSVPRKVLTKLILRSLARIAPSKRSRHAWPHICHVRSLQDVGLWDLFSFSIFLYSIILYCYYCLRVYCLCL